MKDMRFIISLALLALIIIVAFVSHALWLRFALIAVAAVFFTLEMLESGASKE